MTLDNYTEEKRLLELQFQTEKYKLLINHNLEIFRSEENDESDLSRSKMLLRQASESVFLTQAYLDLSIKLFRKCKPLLAETSNV